MRMANVKQGQTVPALQWWKHLREWKPSDPAVEGRPAGHLARDADGEATGAGERRVGRTTPPERSLPARVTRSSSA